MHTWSWGVMFLTMLKLRAFNALGRLRTKVREERCLRCNTSAYCCLVEIVAKSSLVSCAFFRHYPRFPCTCTKTKVLHAMLQSDDPYLNSVGLVSSGRHLFVFLNR